MPSKRPGLRRKRKVLLPPQLWVYPNTNTTFNYVYRFYSKLVECRIKRMGERMI